MIYFENHAKGKAGLNNHVIPYTLCVAISNFLERDFFFDYEIPTSTLPAISDTGRLKAQLDLVINSKRSLVSDLLEIPARRIFDIDREAGAKFRVDDPMTTFMTDGEMRDKFASTMIWNFFSLGRTGLIKEELAEYDLIEFGSSCIMNASYYFFLGREAKRTLLESIRIRYRRELEELAHRIGSAFGRYNAIHLRLGDFQSFYGSDGYLVEPESFAAVLNSTFNNRDLPVLVATDEFQHREIFATLLDGFRYEFVDEIILGEFFDDFGSLPFSDFNALSVLNQLICAASERFVGTFRSTFTGVIHRLRQERYAKTDFIFFPDARVRRQLDPDFNIVPDSRGFFEWNQYSAFSEHYTYPAWMREWNYELTAI